MELDAVNAEESVIKSAPVSAKVFLSKYGEFITSAGYFIVFILAVTYLPTTHLSSIALFKNILAMVGFCGFSINHLLSGLDKCNIIRLNQFHSKGSIYKLFRVIIHSSIVLYAILVYTIDSRKHEMTMYKARLYNKPYVFGTSINVILVLFSHIYLIFVTLFGGIENIGYLGLLLVFAMDCYNGDNNTIFSTVARIANFLVSFGYTLIIF